VGSVAACESTLDCWTSITEATLYAQLLSNVSIIAQLAYRAHIHLP
jgi:hypothetical protein